MNTIASVADDEGAQILVGAAAGSVHSLLVGARPRPLRVSSLGAAPARFWGMPTGARVMLASVTPKMLWRDHKLRHKWQAQGDQVEA